MNINTQKSINQIQTIKKKLLQERERLHQSEIPSTKDNDNRVDIKVEKPTNSDEHIDPVELEKDIVLQDHILDSIAQIDQVLARLDQGKYGICINCEKEIPDTRLCAFPAALRCIECKQDFEIDQLNNDY